MVKKTARTILKTIEENLEGISEKDIKDFIVKISNSKNIFIVGAGRSGLVGKSFGMRLMHLGYSIFIVGDTITPSIGKEDLLIAISGSGKTPSVKLCLSVASKKETKIAIITSAKKSTFKNIANVVIRISKSVRKSGNIDDYEVRQLKGTRNEITLTPLGTIFKLSSLIFCDSVIAKLMEIKKISEEDMKKKHANLE